MSRTLQMLAICFTVVLLTAGASLRKTLQQIGTNGAITDRQARRLCKNRWIEFDFLTSLTDRQAESLGKVEDSLSLDGLTSLTDRQAESLSGAPRISLDGLTSLTDQQTESLSRVDDLGIASITSLTDQQAESLSKIRSLSLGGLLSLSVRQAESLSKVDGYLYISKPLRSLVDKYKSK